MTLVIMAAGMGSRFGGLKQLTPLTDDREFIIDFTVYDAVRAGFDKVIFIIKEENLELFEETIGSRIRKSGIEVSTLFRSRSLRNTADTIFPRRALSRGERLMPYFLSEIWMRISAFSMRTIFTDMTPLKNCAIFSLKRKIPI